MNRVKNNNKKGFTLVELIVVIAILAILAMLVIPKVSGYVADASRNSADANARTAELALKSYMADERLDGIGKDGAKAAFREFELDKTKLTVNEQWNLRISSTSGAVTVAGSGKDGGSVTVVGGSDAGEVTWQ